LNGHVCVGSVGQSAIFKGGRGDLLFVIITISYKTACRDVKATTTWRLRVGWGRGRLN
jgi:hypothetical protein